MNKISFGYYLIFCSVFVTFCLFVLSKDNLSLLTNSPLRSLSQISALLGATLLCITYVLATRTGIVEQLFHGLDKVYKAHHLVSSTAYLFILYHPLLLILNALPNLKLASKYIFISTTISYDLGIMAFLVLSLLIILTLFVNLPYNIWKETHEFMGLVVMLAMLHVFLIDSDVSNNLVLRIYMLSWLTIGLSAFFYRRFLYRYLRKPLLFKITIVNQQRDCQLLTLTPLEKNIVYQPGQFAFFSVTGNPQITAENHPYSFVSHPSEPVLRLGIKMTGDHTHSLTSLKVGDQVKVNGPFGQFGSRLYTDKPVIMIGAGIGITPIIPLAKEAVLTRKSETTVYYVTDSLENAPFHQEIENICRGHHLIKYIKINTKADGRLDLSLLQKNHPKLKDCLVFICGPIPMMTSLEHQLVSYGLKHSQIIYEDFSFK